MRTVATSVIPFTSKAQALNDSLRVALFIESADPVDLQARVAAALAPFIAAEVWQMAHADLAGGGDGHTFIFWAEVYNATVLSGGGGLDLLSDFMDRFWMAAQSEALANANDATVAAIFPVTELVLRQTLLGGASQGTRVMGAYLGAIEERT